MSRGRHSKEQSKIIEPLNMNKVEFQGLIVATR